MERTTAWWEKATAIFALFSLLISFFNLTYVPMRDVYLHYFPAIVEHYDPLKGITPHPFTKDYLETVDQLDHELSEQPDFGGKTQPLLNTLSKKSEEMIENNPFLIAGKFGTFARIKRLIREHTGEVTAKEGLRQFWSPENFQTNGKAELNYFQEKIAPLLSTNYYREVDDYGRFIDDFWRIDLIFIVFFALELATRTTIITYRTQGINWFDALLRRWYDWFLLLPFWRWLRIIPVLTRLHTSKVIDFERILSQITYEPAAYLSDRVSQYLLVRIINQARNSVVEGEAANFLLNPQPYLKVSDANKVEILTDRLLALTIYKVLPQVQPDVEALLHYALRGAFLESDFYQNLQQVPGIENLPDEWLENLSNQLAKSSVKVLVSSYEDAEGQALFDKLSTDFKAALKEELKHKETLAEIETLLGELLEEVKINYIKKSEETDPIKTMEEVEQLNTPEEKG
ncbi:hypothetical protein PCC7418_3525 [Halothece sp. PCC 7418]|uniref:hypothetical protein n=1 Tax=Halothece sp. (strain PCC 7418) TaxID=65093 RepID=UPI0002A087B5|nr:hypothetical protein [Halothece sp. PCC 7418]AFZ45636.1 hypothetical protein PCC7418_3525 [Halothece sp. PCC 7418]